MSDKMDINEAVMVFNNAIMSKVEHRAWQTLKAAVLAQQTNNSASAEIALRLEELLPHINGNLGSNMAGYIKQVINAVVAQLRT